MFDAQGVADLFVAAATVAPHKPDADGSAVWVLEITLTNPGRMPIDNVHCTIYFDRPVRRLRYDGSADELATSLNLEQTVLLGGSSRSWTRTIRARFDADVWVASAMRARVSFDDMHGDPQTTSWPRKTAQRPGLVAD